jgi:thioredoxin-dependent peroxiredoxin
MKHQVTMNGNPLKLLGNTPEISQKAPDFSVLDNSLAPKKLSDFIGKTLVISAVPSLDTPVCDTETRKFNEMAANLGDNVQVLTISMDLPFAQARWCGAAGIEQVSTLSDYAQASFGENYGILIENLRLLARAVFVIDKNAIVQYVQIVPEVSQEPDYDAVLKAVKQL